jgi:two-component system LytT family response regulator
VASRWHTRIAAKSLNVVICLRCLLILSCLFISGGTVAVALVEDTSGVGTSRARKDSNAQNFVTNHFVFLNVNTGMGWSPQIESRLREIRMMIPEIRAIVADEPLAREELRLLLAEETGVEIVAECNDVLQTISAVKTHKPDLLLLDVEMQDSDGVQLLNCLSREDMPIVIFTSVHHHNAVRAFEAHAFDFLLKPFDQLRLHSAIERTRAELVKSHDHRLTNHILDLLAEASSGSRSDRRLVVKTAGRVVFVDIDEIDWVEAAGNYVELRTRDGRYLIREGIGRIAEKLDPNQFVRIHRSIIVNVRKIKELQPCNRGEYMVVLKDGKQLSCSRSFRARLQQLIAVQ